MCRRARFGAADVEADLTVEVHGPGGRMAAIKAVVLGVTDPGRWTDARGTRFVEVTSEPVLLFQHAPKAAGAGVVHLDIAPPVGRDQAADADGAE